MRPFLLFLLSIAALNVHAQKPKNGTYKYTIAFAEWQGKSLGSTCTVRISGDSITIINNGTVSGKKGEVIESGLIMKHIRTGKWIVAHSPADKYAKEIGGCTDGPPVIDFKNKKFWLC